ncbi:MAG: hypothetical protein ABIK28_00330 [Planctomycetota bacterium]
MKVLKLAVSATLILCAFMVCSSNRVSAQTRIEGNKLDPSQYEPGVIESMEVCIERNKSLKAQDKPSMSNRGISQGQWKVPSRRVKTNPSSGEHCAINQWGDTRMGIRFPEPVHVYGAYFAGLLDENTWTPGIRVIGYRNGIAVHETEWFKDLAVEPRWFAMDLQNVDRIEIVAKPVIFGGGWYTMDDLTYVPVNKYSQKKTVVNFDDLKYDTKLTGSDYAGLTWETGTGDFSMEESVHSPVIKLNESATRGGSSQASRDSGTPPILLDTFQGVIRGDAGSNSYPPDTDGAIGPNHYVETVNRNFAIYSRSTGAELVNILLGSFLPGSNGDPRILFDHHSNKWIVLVTDFDTKFFLAVSLTDDPTGSWFKTSFLVNSTGDFPDYPTLGVDANGIYSAAYIVDSGGMSIFAIDKAPLVGPSPHLGTVTEFPYLDWEGAIQPAHTYGTPAGEYCISVSSSSSLHLRRVDPPLTGPTLVDLGVVSVPSFSEASNAPALGSTIGLNTVDDRLMMSVYRDGSLWTAHTIDVTGRAGCRWYEINTATKTLVQSGNVADSSLHYFFPGIMVNKNGDVVMGFSGSNSSQYAGCYYTGRLSTDPLGEMAPPVQYKAGTGPQNNIDSYGRNRWGDYSYTTLDPVDETTFFTIQEYGHDTDIWGTYIASLETIAPPLRINLVSSIPNRLNPGLASTFQVEIEDGGETYVPGSGKIFYRYAAGSFTEVALTTLGSGLFEATLPNTEPGDAPEFYFQAEGDGGAMVTLPSDAPAGLFSFDVFFIETMLEDDFETESGWTVLNTSVDTGEWERGDPAGTDAQPEDDHTPSGTQCFVTGKAGGTIGNDDLDGGPTRLLSPAIDLSTGDAEIDYYLWFYHSTNGVYSPLSVQISNNNGTSWVNVESVDHNPLWTQHTFVVSDYVTPTSQIRVRFTATDNPNDSVVEALLDDFSVKRYVYNATLWADRYTTSVTTNAVVNFTLDAGTSYGNRNFLMLGSVTGTSPGSPLPGGKILPLNWDLLTDIILGNIGSPVFLNFLGQLNASGRGQATLNVPGPFDPGLVGLNIYFAYLLGPPPGFNFTSNAVSLTMEP